MGLGPDVWGPHGWKFIHFITLGYPKNPTIDDKNNYKNFFNMIPNILPCIICKNHFKENMIKHPLTDDIMSDRIKLLNWSIDMHNEVNLINNKPFIDYEQGLKLIINNYNSNTNTNNNNTNNKIYQVQPNEYEQEDYKQKDYEQEDYKQKDYKQKDYKQKNYTKEYFTNEYEQEDYKQKDYTNYIILFIIIILIIFFLYYNTKKIKLYN